MSKVLKNKFKKHKINQHVVRIELLVNELAPSYLCQKLIVSLCSFPNEILKWDVKQRGWGPLIVLIDAFRTLCGTSGRYATLGMSVPLKMAAYLPHHLKALIKIYKRKCAVQTAWAP